MYKEILRRLLPSLAGSLAGVLVVVWVLYLLGWEDIGIASQAFLFIFIIYACGEFYSIRKKVIAEKLAEHTVITPLPIVYKNGGHLYSKPYLDLEKLDRVWGIDVNNVFFKSTIETIAFTDFIPTYSKVQDIIIENNNLSPQIEYTLPNAKVMEHLKKHREPFTATILLLKHFGLKANDWRNVSYWCWGEGMQPATINFDPKDQIGAQPIKDDNKSFLRLVLRTD